MNLASAAEDELRANQQAMGQKALQRERRIALGAGARGKIVPFCRLIAGCRTQRAEREKSTDFIQRAAVNLADPGPRNLFGKVQATGIPVPSSPPGSCRRQERAIMTDEPRLLILALAALQPLGAADRTAPMG